MSKRSEEAAMKTYPNVEGKMYSTTFGTIEFDRNAAERKGFREGYEQAEKDTLEKAIEWWRPRLCGFLKEGLTEGVLGEFRKAMEE